MLQFGNALYKNDHQSKEILEFIELIRIGEKLSTGEIEKIRALTTQTTYPRRSLLVYVRLFFWGYITYDEASLDLVNLLGPDTFKSFDAFERTEIVTCLGPRLASILTGIDISDLKNYGDGASNEISVDFNSRPESDEIWCYTPPPTGFFSLIENILIAKFICRLQGKEFRLDKNFNSWWRYPVNFESIFPEFFKVDDKLNDRPVKYLQWEFARDLIKTVGHDVLKYFSKFKVEEYKKIRVALEKWLKLEGESVAVSAQSAVYFIRGGDKLALETVVPPEHVIEYDFNHIFKMSDHFMVLSDDYRMAEDFRIRYGKSKIDNITEKICAGYYANCMSTVDDVRRIIKNYMVIASVRYSMSCPSSNLVNAAHWSNNNLELLRLSSTPVLRYCYL